MNLDRDSGLAERDACTRCAGDLEPARCWAGFRQELLPGQLGLFLFGRQEDRGGAFVHPGSFRQENEQSGFEVRGTSDLANSEGTKNLQSGYQSLKLPTPGSRRTSCQGPLGAAPSQPVRGNDGGFVRPGRSLGAGSDHKNTVVYQEVSGTRRVPLSSSIPSTCLCG